MKRSVVFLLGAISFLGACSKESIDSIELSQNLSISTSQDAVSNFVKVSGRGQDIGIGGVGSNEKICLIGWNEQTTYEPNYSTADPYDYSFVTRQYDGEVYIYNKNTNNWDKIDGIGKRITVDNQGTPWLINRKGEIYRRDVTNSYWIKLNGQAKDIGAGADGSIYIIGYGNSNKSIYRWNGNGWSQISDGNGVTIDVDNIGKPWMINSAGDVYRRDAGWTKLPGQLKDIGIGANGSIFGIGFGTGNKGIYQYLNNTWVKVVTGEAVVLDVDQQGHPWVITEKGEIYDSY